MNQQLPGGPETDATYLPDMTPRREGGDDSLAEASPFDPRSDEKVLTNKKNEPTKPESSSTKNSTHHAEESDS